MFGSSVLLLDILLLSASFDCEWLSFNLWLITLSDFCWFRIPYLVRCQCPFWKKQIYSLLLVILLGTDRQQQ